MRISAKVDFSQVVAELRDTTPKMVPYAAATTLTALVKDARTRVQKRMPQVFDRPTDFTIRGVYTKAADKNTLTAELYVPDSESNAGKPQREYIRPGAEGATQRNQKKTEFLLTRMGYLPSGWVTTPGRGVQLDAFGNVPGSIYKQIINVLQIRYNKPKPISKASQRRAGKMGVQAEFFAVAPGANSLAKGGGWLPPGVWRHLPGHHIVQVLKFVKRATYRRRLDLATEVQQEVEKQLRTRWAESVTIITSRFAKRSG